MARTVHCSAHCRACGTHFSSTAAFDAHRQGPAHARRCEHPAYIPRLAKKAELEGHCPFEGRVDVKVTVWALAASLESASERVSALVSAQEAA